MIGVLIVPTGIGAKIGGHAGDANPVAKLLAACCDKLIVHPNVVNASDINEMPDNALYVEGSILDRFLEGKFCLEKPKSNKILLAVNKPVRDETINAVNAARHTIGCEIEILELALPLVMIAEMSNNGAGGKVYDWENLVNQVERYNFDALAISTQINCSKEVCLDYLRNGGINPWGGIEAIASKLIANAINKPVAHAPIESDDPDIRFFNEKVDSREAAEVLSMTYIHCVFKGLHKAPRISDRGLSIRDIDFMVSPWGCIGRPHKACLKANIPVIMVKENQTVLNDEIPSEFIRVENYWEAVGVMMTIKVGITRRAVRWSLNPAEINA